MGVGVVIDTSYLITLADPSRAHHETARRYWRHFMENQWPVFLPTIVVSEFCLKQQIPVEILRWRMGRRDAFRATARLSEYLVKGFTMDDERLKNPPGKGQKDYFSQLVFAGLRGAEVEDAGERTGSETALLSKRLAAAVPKLNPALPSDAVEQVVRSIWPLNPVIAQEGVPL